MQEKRVLLALASKEIKHERFPDYLEIPAMESEYEDILHKVRIVDVDIEKAKIHISSRNLLPQFGGMEVCNASVEELNFFAERVSRLSEEELFALSAVLDIGRRKGLYEEGIKIKDLINMTYELENSYVLPGIGSDKEFGEALICAQSEEYMENMTEE